MNWTLRQSEDLQTELWLLAAAVGRFVLPLDLSGAAADAVTMALANLEFLRANKEHGWTLPPAHVFVNTNTGDFRAWEIARLTEALEATVHIGQYCISAGLIVAVAGKHRVCRPDTKFGWHGSTAKPGHDPSHKDDEARAVYMAERTKVSAPLWLVYAQSGNLLEFGAEEALDWGVVDEVGP